jgi:homocysteine S-methyltransferase
MRLAVDLAADARRQFLANGARRRARPLLGLSLGSYGACLCDGSEFRGDYADTVSCSELAAWHLSRLLPVIDHPEVRCRRNKHAVGS